MPIGYGFDWTYLLIVPALILAVWAQFKVSSTFKKYSQIGASRGIDTVTLVKQILSNYGVNNVAIEMVPGHLTDHYDPKNRVLRLSESTYNSNSIAALGVAAHEAGHAIQHAKGYTPIAVRNAVYPLANIGSFLAFPLFFIGIIFSSASFLMPIGIALFSFAVFFSIVTLPVEFDASGRALKVLASGGYLSRDELAGARKVLTAAGLTYVASALMAVLQLVRLLLLSRSSD